MTRRRLATAAGAAAMFAAACPSGASAAAIDFGSCGEGAAPEAQCATLEVPRDYRDHGAGSFTLAISRSRATDSAHRLGTLFFNFGGPGAPAAGYVAAYGAQLFPELNKRYDIVGVDPRGVGDSTPAIDCKANQETEGIYRQPFVKDPFSSVDDSGFQQYVSKSRAYVGKCVDNNAAILPYVSTANVARDFDRVRRALGEQKINYLGFSYGTYLGTTFARLFPGKFDRMVLDGPIDADAYANHPFRDLSAQTAGFERALDRFMQACAADQVTCEDFGGKDPLGAFDQLVDDANANPIPRPGYVHDPRPVDGDDILNAVIGDLYAKQYWPEIAHALASAADGDPTLVRQLSDASYGVDDTGNGTDPGNDRYFTIGAIDQDYPKNVLQPYFDAGAQSLDQYDHFSFNNGYVEVHYGLFPIRGKGVYRGPFTLPSGANTPLVIATRYDPATPFQGAKNLVRTLGRARLLEMFGDGHTAYQNGSPTCIDPAVETYFDSGQLPPAGKVCPQDDAPFQAPSQEVAPSVAAVDRPYLVQGPHRLK